MSSAVWLVIFKILFVIKLTTSNPYDTGIRHRKCYCDFLENLCPLKQHISLRLSNDPFFTTECATNQVIYCDIPDGLMSETCGKRKLTVMRRKKNGEAKTGQYPWQAVILRRKDDGNFEYIGSGVLINKKHVLTTAHKVDSAVLSNLKIRLGEWDLSSNEEVCEQQDYRASRIIKHPKFNSDTLESNIALIILDHEVPLATTAHISTACLSSGVPVTGTRCWVAGWGRNPAEFATGSSNLLKDLNVPIVDRFDCQIQVQRTLGDSYDLPENVFCAGEGKLESCMIEGGAPLVCESTTGQWEVVGLVSAAISCHQNVPSIYTDVHKFVSWIHQQVFDNY
ncbi:inactive CLIP domain-containing serine protease A28 [Microplitis demolitor]|uniref:inactive CLIP domain-containing serine protease A28 n=1 Tax=Microplitis demolitor TaxID=69319 RepID=UPI0004CDDB07|nr:inactive CLIP domain-containing serine protease A28 [Microplitis demolitor]